MLQELQSLCETQGSEPLPFSLQHAQQLWLSKLAIKWPHPPCVWPGEDIMI